MIGLFRVAGTVDQGQPEKIEHAPVGEMCSQAL